MTMRRKKQNGISVVGTQSSDDVVRRKSNPKNTNNPFELKLTREKHGVLNQREKHSRGTPGASRSKALQKRKHTLLEEYRNRNKANEFVDKRLGECDADMTLEEKMLARFAAERKSHHEKGDIYNLNDEEQLTHFGQSLADIEKFEDPRSDDEDEDDRDKNVGDKLGARFVKAAHFGGFLTKKEGGGEEEKTRQDMIDEMIAKSKQRKYERQSEREATEEMTDKVDAEWSQVRSLLAAFQKPNAEEETKKTVDEYDMVVRELKFDIRAKPTDRLKTPEEQAKDEKEKLEKLEADRLRRMSGVRETEKATKDSVSREHKSADDLDDGFTSSKKDDKRFHLSYKKDGEVRHDEYKTGPISPKKKVTFVEDSKKASDEVTTEEEEEEQEEEEDDDDDEQESDESDHDSYADILSEESDNDEDKNTNSIESSEDKVSKIKTDLKERKTIMDSARKELAYTFAVPATYEALMDLIQGHTTADQLVILERMIKCNHPCLSDENVPRLETLFAFLLQWIDDLTSSKEPILDAVDGLMPILFDLVQFSPMNMAHALLDVVLKKNKDFQNNCDRKNARAPGLNTVIFFKLVVALFPASDFSHLVVTPTFLFMAQILTQSTISVEGDIAVGLFVCSLFLECVSLSKRFIPEALNFLRGCFLSSLKNEGNEDDLRPFVHPFKPIGPSSDLLLINGDCRQSECGALSIRRLQSDDVITDSFRLSALYICISLLRRFAELYSSLPSFPITFNPILEHQRRLPFDRLPERIKDEMEGLVDFLEQHKSTFALASMAREQRKPKPMKLLEPLIDEQFDGRRRRKGDPETLEKQRFEHRYKREMKGAIREIRRDNRFLANQHFVEQHERDAERKRKLKEIYQDLASQEGFCKTLERKKMKK